MSNVTRTSNLATLVLLFQVAASAASLVLTSSVNPSILGQPVVLTATVTPGNATGNVTFYDGTTVLGTRLVSNGGAALTTGQLPFGVRQLKAYYSGDAGNTAATSIPLTITVNTVPDYGFSRHPYTTPFGTFGFPSVFSVALGDFNGDGKTDLTVANYQAGNISVLAGNGNGTFQAAVNYTALGRP